VASAGSLSTSAEFANPQPVGIVGYDGDTMEPFARRNGGSFVRDNKSAAIMQQINTDTLNYAPATAALGLEIFFTRLDPAGPAIYMAGRTNKSAPFGTPRKISSITGFAAGPSLAADGNSLYYHKKENGCFRIYRVTRK